MAISTLPESSGQEEQATTEVARPRGITARERFDNLPQGLKDKILDEYRYWDTEHVDWWDSVYDNFKEEMREKGIHVERMYFSGFCSQGDGACFEGDVYDWGSFLKSLGYNDTALINHADRSFAFSCNHSGYYYHENCVKFSTDLPLPESADDQDFARNYANFEDDSLHEAVWLAQLNKYSESALENQFSEAFKDHMRELYTQLEDEYEYLTSDEQILEALEANDLLEEAIETQLENEDA